MACATSVPMVHLCVTGSWRRSSHPARVPLEELGCSPCILFQLCDPLTPPLQVYRG